MPPQPGSGADDEVILTFALFEANGTTPVAVLPTPEPSTFALLCIGTGLLPIFFRRRAAARRN
jgi:hypothetical protein